MGDAEETGYRVTADELFAQVGEVVELVRNMDEMGDASDALFALHRTLVLTCHEGIRGTAQAYGNLFAQVDYLCRKQRVAVADRVAVQTLRWHSNRQMALSHQQLMVDARALCVFIASVFQVPVPSSLVHLMAYKNVPHEKRQAATLPYLRCVVQKWDDRVIDVVADQEHEEKCLQADYSAEHLQYLKDVLREGMQLNLLDCSIQEDYLLPRMIVVEPDFLIDISSIAACFESYGHHPLNYTLSRMVASKCTQPILLGNLAGDILDCAIHENQGEPASLNDVIRSSFRQSAAAYCTCVDFNPEQFLKDAKLQSDNINQAVELLFNEFQREKAILEPSFVCERLGIQGRVDLMTTDFRLLVEQKSGKNWNIERGFPGEHGSMMLEPNYVQLLLYYGMLHYNFNLAFDQINLRLLYSRYSADKGLVVVNYLQRLFREAVSLRNLIVAWELHIAKYGFESIIDMLQPEVLNVRGRNDRFYVEWKLPELQSICQPLRSLSPLERAYFCTMMTFLYREQRVGRLGLFEGIGNCSSDLWNMPLSQKIETGNIFVELTVEKREKTSSMGGFDKITLNIPQQGDTFLPNFRPGDMVYLYHYENQPDVRNSILYKGILQEVGVTCLVVVLSDGQQNKDIFVPVSRDESMSAPCYYAIEHAPADTTTLGIRSLFTFITSPQERRDLLLTQRWPQRDETVTLSHSYHPDYDEVLTYAKQAKDYYLLIGPPGTGKTSMALRFLVEEELACPNSGQKSEATNMLPSLLLMSYTNRAVDEICTMLVDARIPFIRIGSEQRCDVRFRKYLLSAVVDKAQRLDRMKEILRTAPVIVGTTTTIAGYRHLFALKRFSLTIVDEASQILEPSIVGLLSLVGKFILIGDHKQLPAVVQQSTEDSRVENDLLRAIAVTDCRRSLFERLLANLTAMAAQQFPESLSNPFVGILHKQGRMHPSIAKFPTMMFYPQEQLTPVPLPHQLEVPDHPLVVFIPSKFCLRPGQSDQVNDDEAQIVARQVMDVWHSYGERFNPNTTVGVIVPYRNQIAVVRQELAVLVERLPEKERDACRQQLGGISIDTVERYQGSQRDVIIYSFTVQHSYQMEFLTASCFVETDADGNQRVIDRKLNVALTRARKQLIITGNPTILSANPIFRRLMDSSDGGESCGG